MDIKAAILRPGKWGGTGAAEQRLTSVNQVTGNWGREKRAAPSWGDAGGGEGGGRRGGDKVGKGSGK